jgi:hypothetical protein
MPVRPPRVVFAAVIIALLSAACVAALTGTAPESASPTAPSASRVDSVERSGAPEAITSPTPQPTSTVAPTTSASPTAPTRPSSTTTTASAASSSIIAGAEKVWVSVLSATPQTTDDVNTGLTQSGAQTLVSELNSYWSSQSNGAVTIQLGGFETRSLSESTCDPNAALAAEEAGSFGGMFANGAWKGTHNHLLVLSAESCNADSFATVGGTGGEIFSGNGVGTGMGVPYLLHEFGHNLGFEHADASICTNTTSFDGRASDFSFTSAVCPTREYDDYFDIMGYTVKNATPNLSSPQRILSGWLPNYLSVTSSNTQTVTALGGSGGTQALSIVDPVSGDTYYVEYRTDSGLDATSAEFNYGLQCDPAMSGYTICELDSNKTTGVVRILRVLPFPSAGADGTTVMATALTAGSSDTTKRHTHLGSGDTFTSLDGSFTIRVVSLSPGSGAVVSVTFAGPHPTPTPTPSYTTVPATASAG